MKANRQYWLFGLILLGFLLLSAHFYTYHDAVTKGFSDVVPYVKMATAPDFTSFHALSNDFAIHHLERWPVHLFVGTIISITGLDFWTAYRLGVLVCLLLVIFLVGQLQCSATAKKAFLVLVLFSPYTFRQYLAVPAMISDCLFYTAVIGFAVGMYKRNLVMLTGFAVLACLARQTGIILVPILLVYCLIYRVELKKTLLMIGLVALTFLLVKELSQILFIPKSTNYVFMHTLGIFVWLMNEPHWLEWIDFIGRYGLMLISILPMMILLRPGQVVQWWYVIFFLILGAQPLLAGPFVTGSNIDRLAIYGLPFLGLLFLEEAITAKQLVVFTILTVLVSFQPQFSLLHFVAGGRYYFVALAVFVGLISLLLWRKNRISNQTKNRYFY